ncbi:MAG: ribonuclease E/G [Holosporaceae bacterium]|nr:ribonuclease E/G [Holosporaceae bacterium]
MLIDSAHEEEIRVAIVDGEKLDKFDFESPSKAQTKGNIYLAKIARVEPSLQAAFVDYGSERHGFLSFSEIHPDYFQIPVGDRQDLEDHMKNALAALLTEAGDTAEGLNPKEISRLRYQFYRRYKIQEVIKKRQIVLIQVVKEERGNKGAAVTTYLSLAGRYCVLLPNTAKGSGISRKITNQADRVKLKKIVSDFQIENGSTVIRTAGIGHSKAEITKDFNYLKKMWDEIRETTIKSTAPCLVQEEASIIKRAIRDLYSRDVESIFVEGEEGYKTAKTFIKKLIPSHTKKVRLYEDKKVPLFTKFKVNDQINQIYSARVELPSGGYLIINTTEALISIDVNSGKATHERNISETALRTNLEAAVEIARHCRLRDLAGLIVVDFIDMVEKRDNIQVERCLREALRNDKAKIQVGSISSFGLLEFSRQRLRPSITDANMVICPHCEGAGFTWSEESTAIRILRKIEETLATLACPRITVTLSKEAAQYLINNKRSFISGIEERMNSRVILKIDGSIPISDFKIEQIPQIIAPEEGEASQDKGQSTGKAENDVIKSDEYNSSNKDQLKDNNKRQSAPNFSKNNISGKSNYSPKKEFTQESSTDFSATSLNEKSKKKGEYFYKRKRNNTVANSGPERQVSIAEWGGVGGTKKEKALFPSENEFASQGPADTNLKNGNNTSLEQKKTFDAQPLEEQTKGRVKEKRIGWWQKLLQKPE